MKFTNEYLIGSAKRAMSGVISDNIIAIFLQYKNEVLSIRFFYSSPFTENEEEIEGDIAAEIAADLPGIRSIDSKSEVMNKDAEIKMEDFLQVYRKTKNGI